MERTQIQLTKEIIDTARTLGAARLQSVSAVLRGWILVGMQHDSGIMQTDGIKPPTIINPTTVAKQLIDGITLDFTGLPLTYPHGTPTHLIDPEKFYFNGREYVRRERPRPR